MILFTNPGELDLRLVSTFGINVKPNTTNPVGYFGTGLKYALAVLAREGCDVVIHIGEKRYHLEAKSDSVRGKNVEFLYLAPGQVEEYAIPLPYTSDLGRNWKLWMAYRELYYNCLDEGGEAYLAYDGIEEVISQTGFTQILVEGLDEVHASRDEFLLLSKPLYSTPNSRNPTPAPGRPSSTGGSRSATWTNPPSSATISSGT